MEIKLKWSIGEGEFDTKTMELICIPARQRVCHPDEHDAQLCIKDGMNLNIADIHMGDMESSNILCQELVRRWNEFPEELKR